MPNLCPLWMREPGQPLGSRKGRHPNLRSREVSSSHLPETLNGWTRASLSFRSGITSLPPLDPAGLRRRQFTATTKLEATLKADRLRALVQMADGPGKTFAAVMQVYSWQKRAGPCRALRFLSILAIQVPRRS